MTFDPPHPVDALKARGVVMTAGQEAELRRVVDAQIARFDAQIMYGSHDESKIPVGAFLTTADRLDLCREPDPPPPKPWIQKAFRRAPKRLGMKR